MVTVLVSGMKASSIPSKRGLSLGWRLALSAVLIISFVMGGITFVQQRIKLENERALHEELLTLSLVPLAVRLESVTRLEDMKREMEAFHAAYVEKDQPLHEVVLLDASNDPVHSTMLSHQRENDLGHLQGVLSIFSPLLKDGKGRLILLKSSENYMASVRREWLMWGVHFSATVGVLFIFLAASIYLQVTKPVNRLMRNVTKMEMGYWKPIELVGGAWEIRWLAWRFGSMVQEVKRTMTHLFEAEQKARHSMTMYERGHEVTNQESLIESVIASLDHTDSASYNRLLATCERAEAASSNDPQATHIGHSIWHREALEADRLGFHHIKIRLEDAALRLIDPETFRSLDSRLSEQRASWQGLADQYREALYRLLEDNTIPCVAVLHRMKHTAGVWAKMRGKNLDIDEIYDLFAFRIIVPTEADCYAALGLIHQAYNPVLSRFKDYIAKAKANGYRSLHTCVSTNSGPVFEVQIRSIAMDRQAERGGAAHWHYKETGRDPPGIASNMGWWDRIRQWTKHWA